MSDREEYGTNAYSRIESCNVLFQGHACVDMCVRLTVTTIYCAFTAYKVSANNHSKHYLYEFIEDLLKSLRDISITHNPYNIPTGYIYLSFTQEGTEAQRG